MKTAARILLLFLAGFIALIMFFAPAALHSIEVRKAFAAHFQNPTAETKAGIERAKAIHRKRILIFEAVCGAMLIGTIYLFRKNGKVTQISTPSSRTPEEGEHRRYLM